VQDTISNKVTIAIPAKIGYKISKLSLWLILNVSKWFYMEGVGPS